MNDIINSQVYSCSAILQKCAEKVVNRRKGRKKKGKGLSASCKHRLINKNGQLNEEQRYGRGQRL